MAKPAALGVAEFTPPPQGDRANALLSGSFSAVGPSKPLNIVGWANLAIWASYNTALTTTAGSTAATVASAGAIAAGAAINSVNVPPGTTVGAISGTNVTLALPPITLSGILQANGVISGLASTAGLLGATVTGPTGTALGTVGAILQPAVSTPSYQAGTSTGSIQLSIASTTQQISTQPQAFTFAPTGNAVIGGTDNAALFTGAGITWSGTVQFERSFDGGNTFIVANIGTGTLAQFTAGTPVSTILSEPESGVLYRFNCTAYNSGVINYRLSTTGAAGGSLPTGGNI